MRLWRKLSLVLSSSRTSQLGSRDGGVRAAHGGVFWSHTLYPQSPTNVSDRDTLYSGRLRNNYSYATSYQVGAAPLVIRTPVDCFGPNCGFFIDTDAIKNLVIQPSDQPRRSAYVTSSPSLRGFTPRQGELDRSSTRLPMSPRAATT